MNLGSCTEFLYMHTYSALKTQRAYLWILPGIVKIRPWNNQDLIRIESNFLHFGYAFNFEKKIPKLHIMTKHDK